MKINIVEKHPPPSFQAPSPATNPLKPLLMFANLQFFETQSII
jgi:hypothetical protein